MCKSRLLILWWAFLAVSLIASNTADAKNISTTVRAGAVEVTLKILPAEAFEGPHATMVRGGGAMPMLLSHSPRPNHHMVVFIKKNRKPVERANVTMLYKKLAARNGRWTLLPVVRMHVAGKGLATTHFGNNVKLAPGDYEVLVVVNHNPPADFHIRLRN